MLQRMPTFDFDAYVRADVSTFYGEEPGTREEFVPDYEGQAGKFVNLSPDRVSLYWDPDNGSGELDFTSNIRPWSSGGTACHPDHKFIIAKADQPDQVLCRFTVTPGTSVYYCDPYTPNDLSNPAKGEYVGEELLSLADLSEEDQEEYKAHMVNLEFAQQYKWFTGGTEWLSMYPRDPPRHKIWRADYFRQEHSVTTKETHFLAEPPEDVMRKLSIQDMRVSNQSENRLSQYRVPGTMNMTIRAVSCAPRAFEIENFLSDVEVDHILNVVSEKNDLERSHTGSGSLGSVSSTRTSRTTWVSRDTDPILNAVFRRVADALRMDEALLRPREAGERDDDYPESKRSLSEELQVVHYAKGQEYTAHHDFGYPKAGQPGSPSRSINLCMYLNDVAQGGQTSFVRWRNGHTSSSLDVTPKKGKAMIFFMLTPDGNLDDLTHHAALPVLEGEKWFANLWIHDPVRL
jgi:prolyl 4-hydroxylase